MKNKILTTSDDANPNYLAQIVKLEKLEKHPNADRLLLATVNNQVVITGNTAKLGDLYVYFPVESQISEAFLSFTNSFESQENNRDPKKKGFVGKHRRIKMVKLREVFSEGYIVSAKDLVEFVKERYKQNLVIDDDLVNYCFDTVGGELFINKFVAKIDEPNVAKSKTKGKVQKYLSKLVSGQFSFHPDTINLKRNVEQVNPNDYISIDYKYHGSNGICANVLVKRKLSLVDKISRFFGAKIKDTEYGLLYSSRTIIKNSKFVEEGHQGYYKQDIWKDISDKLFPKLDQGITATFEVFGYLNSGKYVQKGYDYGCNTGELGYVVFNITYTSPEGNVYTFSPEQLRDYCKKKSIPCAENFYYGKAKDLFPEISTENHWHKNFLAKLEETYLEKCCHICKNKIPAEGVIVRVDKPNEFKALKLKSKLFLAKETETLDAGLVDV